MSTEIETDVAGIFITSLWGGNEKGKCIQITMTGVTIAATMEATAWKSFTREDIIKIRDAMTSWIDNTYPHI